MPATAIRKSKTYKLADAIRLVERHGFASHVVNEFNVDANPLVAIHQEWTNKGEEMAVFIRARGKWRGNSAGFSFRK